MLSQFSLLTLPAALVKSITDAAAIAPQPLKEVAKAAGVVTGGALQPVIQPIIPKTKVSVFSKYKIPIIIGISILMIGFVLHARKKS